MNLTLEVIISIFIMLIFFLPVLYKVNFENTEEKLDVFKKYYFLVDREDLRACIVNESCNISWLQSYSLCKNGWDLRLDKIKFPKEFFSFWIFGKEENYCPSLVIVDLEKI